MEYGIEQYNSYRDKCRKCGEILGELWIERGRKYCLRCHKEMTGAPIIQRITSGEIMGFYKASIAMLKDNVSHSKKGKPQKQPFGFHIVSN
jgi:hypothetical protein